MNYLYTLLLALIITGCEYSNGEIAVDILPIDMEYNKTYTLHKGDKLIKNSDDTIIKITQKTQEDTSDVILIQGNAQIIIAK